MSSCWTGSQPENWPYVPSVPFPAIRAQAAEAPDSPQTVPSAVPTVERSVLEDLQVRLPTTQAHMPLLGVGGRFVLAGHEAF